MAPESSVSLAKRGMYQALNKDYAGSSYHKGHLYPVFHTNTQMPPSAQMPNTADATFTLTNAAPQDPSLNRGQWRKMEKDMAQWLKTKCLPNRAYMVTGVVPSSDPVVTVKNSTVNVPSHFWSAYCCLDNNKKPLMSRGYLVPNSNQEPQSMTVTDLDVKLSKLYSTNFMVFGGKCEAEVWVRVKVPRCTTRCQKLPNPRLVSRCRPVCRRIQRKLELVEQRRAGKGGRRQY